LARFVVDGSGLLNIPAPAQRQEASARFHPADLVPSVHQLTAEAPMSGTQSPAKSLIGTKATSGGQS
jgi:hypothetical protein